jgi:multiple sugar transport system substrate-binding protein
MPVSFSTIVTVINREYKKECPISTFDNLSFSDFTVFLEKANIPPVGNGLYPFYFPVTLNRWPIIIKSFGGAIFSEDEKKCLLGANESIEAINYILELCHKQRVCLLSSIEGNSSPEEVNLFPSGKFMCSWDSGAFRHRYKNLTMSIAPLPYAQQRASHLLIEGIMLNRKSKNRKEIIDFINFIQLYKNQIFISENSDGISCNKEIAKLYCKRQSEIFPGFNSFINSLEYATPIGPPATGKYMKYINERLYPMWLGLEPVKETCKAVAKEIDSFIQKNKNQ